MPDISPFVAASSGAMNHLNQNPLLQAALKQGLFKDIWGSEYSGFMGMDSGGYGDSGEIPDNTQGRTQAFAADVSVYRCVDLRGAAIASVPLKIYNSADPSKRVEVEHEAMGVLMHTNPYAWVAGPQLMRYSLGSRDLHGAFAWRIVNDTGGRLRAPLPRELYWLPPGQYTPVHGNDLKPAQPQVPFAGLRVRPGQQRPEIFLPADQVIYAPTYNPVDPLKGTSRITALRTDLNLRLYGANSNLWFFRNNQRPDVVVTGAFSPTPENVGLMRRIWKAAFGGDGNRGPAFLPSDMRVNLLTMSQKDAEWLGQRQAAREDILAAFGVPPPVYGDLSRATYENIRVAYEAFWRTGMIPELDEMAWVLTQQFLWKWPDAKKAELVFAYDYQAIEALQEDANAIWERTMQMLDRLNTAVERRSLLPDQMRQIAQALFKQAGLPDMGWKGNVPGGNMFYIRLTEVPIIEGSVQANIDSMAARAGTTAGGRSKPGNGSWALPDVREVIGDPVEAAAAAAAAAESSSGTQSSDAAVSPQVSASPRPKAQQVHIHNHLTKLDFPALPPFPDERREARGGLDHGVGREAPTGAAQPTETVQPASPSLHARDLLCRRLKRHFQDQQTAALRTLRAAQESPQGMEDISALLDRQAGYQSARDLIEAGLALSHRQLDAGPLAEDLEATTLRLLVGALLASAEDGEGTKGMQLRICEVFRSRIDSAQGLAEAIIFSQHQESAA